MLYTRLDNLMEAWCTEKEFELSFNYSLECNIKTLQNLLLFECILF